jgi:hypothetical protein
MQTAMYLAAMSTALAYLTHGARLAVAAATSRSGR